MRFIFTISTVTTTIMLVTCLIESSTAFPLVTRAALKQQHSMSFTSALASSESSSDDLVNSEGDEELFVDALDAPHLKILRKECAKR